MKVKPVDEKILLKNLKEELEKKEGKLDRREKRKKELKPSYNKPFITNKIAIPFWLSLSFGGFSFILCWSSSADLVSGVILGIFIGSLTGIFSAIYIIFFDYINPKRLKDNCSNLKFEIQKIEDTIEENIRETKKEALKALIIEGNIELNRGNAINAHRIYQNAQKILNSSEKKYEMESKLLYSEMKLVQENLNQNSIENIEALIEKSIEQKEQGKLGISLHEVQKALEIANKMFTSYNKFEIIEQIKKNINKIYLIQIELLIDQGNKLKIQNSIKESLKILTNALEHSDKMFSSKEKYQIKDNIKKNIDSIYSEMINDKIENGNSLRGDMEFDNSLKILHSALELSDKMVSSKEKNKIKNVILENIDSIYSDTINDTIENGNRLRKEMEFDKSIKFFKSAFKISDKMHNTNKKNSEISKLNNIIYQTRIVKIKNTILSLGVKFDRLHVSEIAEKCKESDEYIINTALDMINKKEIYAEYFKSTKSIVFNQQANVEEIDNLMKKYEQWEKEEKRKI